MRRRAMVVAVWLAGAAVAIALSMWAVGLVGGRIGGRDAAVVSRHDVEQALAVPTTDTTEAPDPSLAGEPAPTDEVGGPSALGAVGETPAPDPVPNAAAPAPTSAVAPSTTAGAAAQEAVYTTEGGSVGVRCVGGTISLLYATPASGWQLHNAAGTGPMEVDVRFEPTSDAKGREVRVRVHCEGGRPVEEIRTDG